MRLTPYVPCILLLAVAAVYSQPQPVLTLADLDIRATLLVKPVIPPQATIADIDGVTLSVAVLVDERGVPLKARCSDTCEPSLKEAAETAALASRFTPLIRNGEAIRYQGFLAYVIAISRVDWYQFGLNLESDRLFNNISI